MKLVKVSPLLSRLDLFVDFASRLDMTVQQLRDLSPRIHGEG